MADDERAIDTGDSSVSLSILHVGLETPQAKPGGLNSYVYELCKALPEAGIGARALLVGDQSPATKPDAFEVVSSPSSPLPLRLLHYWRAIHRGLGEEGTTVVLDVHFALPALLPLIFRGRRFPVVVHFHGPWADESSLQGAGKINCWLKRRAEWLVYHRADRLVVLSTAFRDLLVTRYGISPWAVSVLRPGVDLDRFSPGDLDRFSPGGSGDARHRLGVASDAWVLASARRLVARMGLDVLLYSWAALAASSHTGRPSMLLIAGEGPQRGELEALARRLGVDGSVRFLGRVSDDDLTSMYRAADASVIPSLDLEGFGFVVLESLATGTPVIASDIGGLPEALDGLGHDLLVVPGDVEALTFRLRGARDGTAPMPSPQACRAHAATFSWEQAALRHAALYRDLIDPESPRPRRIVFLGGIQGAPRPAAPLTAAPVTAAPVTAAPVTAAPVTAAPVTAAPVTAAPVTAGSLTAAPLTAVPVTAEEVVAHVLLPAGGVGRGGLRSLAHDRMSGEVLDRWQTQPPTATATAADAAAAAAAAAFPSRVYGFAAALMQTSLRLRRLRPDVVWLATAQSMAIGALAGRFAGVEVRYQVAGDGPRSPFGAPLSRRSRWILRRCKAIATDPRDAAALLPSSPT